MSANFAPWPDDDLEPVPVCPICGEAAREIEHSQLTDMLFDADGKWNLWRCSGCGSGYLDPRPTNESLQRAYHRYYTHGGAPEDQAQAQTLGLVWLKQALGNDYSNHRFGCSDRPTLIGGRWIGRYLPSLSRSRTILMRHLPRAMPGHNRLLDVGSGDGGFLKRAAGAGWKVHGVEPDPKAREASGGIDVRAEIGDWGIDESQFDAVTINHALEHMSDPAAALRDISERMTKGGFLFVDTPNIDAVGHDLFGRHWRGLEPPRHLVLFSAAALSKSLASAGFSDIKVVERPSVFDDLAFLSRMIAERAMETGESPMRLPSPQECSAARVKNRRNTSKREFLTFTSVMRSDDH